MSGPCRCSWCLLIVTRLLKSSGSDGIHKVVKQFLANHPIYAKRQVEIKINEIASKAKHADDRLQACACVSKYESGFIA